MKIFTVQDKTIIIRQLGIQPYLPVSDSMHQFTEKRESHTPDEIWLVQHEQVFTQGQAGKAEHLLNTGSIPVIQSDRGGQVTYHGPGQQVMYVLLDLKRNHIGVRQLVTVLENTVINTLVEFNVNAYARADAPGVYVNGDKICSLGLRIRKGCSFHGLALNVDMDLSPFTRINPCGYPDLKMTQLVDLAPNATSEQVASLLINHFCTQLGFQPQQ